MNHEQSGNGGSGPRRLEAQVEPLRGFEVPVEPSEMAARAANFLAVARRRRSIREFSDRGVHQSVIEDCLRAAGSAPSGANQQPWHFVAVGSQSTKEKIRAAAEVEEHEFYHQRAPGEWLDALAPIGTDEFKPFLSIAPWLIAIFARTHGVDSHGERTKHYYVNESVGIASGLLIGALNHCGLGTLTHTPSPMKFLNEILGRPNNERPFLLLVVGYPHPDCSVPKLEKKSLKDIATFLT
ncbi:MAG: nitroreductase family protein [Aureliella sp.]